MSNEQKLREAFEAHMTDGGKWPNAILKAPGGQYLLLRTSVAWQDWKACAEALTLPTAAPVDEQIEALARKHGTGGWQTLADMVRFGKACMALQSSADVRDVVLAEREACAKVCEQIDIEYEGDDVQATWCAAAIRARSNT